MQIDLTESEYRTLLEALRESAGLSTAPECMCRYTKLRDNLRVRWERAADEQQKEAVK